MKAAVYDRPGAPEVLYLADLPDPVPGPGEILIQVEAISIEGGDRTGLPRTLHQHRQRRPRPRHPDRRWVLRPRDQTLIGYYLDAELAAGPRARTRIGEPLTEVAAGRLRIVIDRGYPLVDAAAARAYARSRTPFGRVLLTP